MRLCCHLVGSWSLITRIIVLSLTRLKNPFLTFHTQCKYSLSMLSWLHSVRSAVYGVAYCTIQVANTGPVVCESNRLCGLLQLPLCQGRVCKGHGNPGKSGTFLTSLFPGLESQGKIYFFLKKSGKVNESFCILFLPCKSSNK